MSDIMTYTPPWWDKEITVYNRFEDKLTNVTTWYRKHLTNCFFAYEGNQLTIGSTVLETNTTICRIPQNKKFKERYLWEELADKSSYFTLGVGDIIVLGNVSDIIYEYAAGHRSTDLINKYKDLQGCIKIQSIALNIGPARCIPHYLVRGE